MDKMLNVMSSYGKFYDNLIIINLYHMQGIQWSCYDGRQHMFSPLFMGHDIGAIGNRYVLSELQSLQRSTYIFPNDAILIVNICSNDFRTYCVDLSYMTIKGGLISASIFTLVPPSKNVPQLFSFFLSVSFCMFLCSKGHFIRAYLYTI